MARYYNYNIVLRDHDNGVKGELLTDKELERRRRNIKIETGKVRVPRDSVYYFFGARFTTLEDNYIVHHLDKQYRRRNGFLTLNEAITQ